MYVGKEHRLGYVDNGFQSTHGKRWTISNNNIFISASARMGAGIDSLVWNNKQFVNMHDHGRELQMACNTDTFTECYNPTECGGRDDSTGSTTKTQIISVSAHGNIMETKVRMLLKCIMNLEPKTYALERYCGNLLKLKYKISFSPFSLHNGHMYHICSPFVVDIVKGTGCRSRLA